MTATYAGKFGLMVIALLAFGIVFFGILLIASLFKGRRGEKRRSWPSSARRCCC
nr:hypothetical protein [Angustibacter aerolatus]